MIAKRNYNNYYVRAYAFKIYTNLKKRVLTVHFAKNLTYIFYILFSITPFDNNHRYFWVTINDADFYELAFS